MDNLLLVPMRVEALVLDGERAVADAMADFTRLPWSDGRQDHNAGVPNLGDAISAQPFRDIQLTLKPGLHLHWQLPEGLTRAGDDSELLRVPNRWLVTRRLDERCDRWVVESDYLAPEGSGHGVAYPVAPDPAVGAHQPWRRLGRVMPIEAWLTLGEDDADRLERLTAWGYGEPAFAGFYPNCHSVLGFYDSDSGLAAAIPAGLEYEVLGWYSDPAQDELKRFVAAFQTEYGRRAGEVPGAVVTRDAVAEAFGWRYAAEPGDPPPSRMACFGRVTFAAQGRPGEGEGIAAEVGLAIGQNGIEALCAYTAVQIDPDQQAMIEDQLIAMSMGSELGHRLIDIGFKFDEARHKAGFNAGNGGTRYTVQPTAAGESADGDAILQGALLPAGIDARLNATNLLQAALDQAEAELEALRRQCYADWARYLLAAHPPLISPASLPSPDAIRAFVSARVLPEIEIHQTATGAGIELRTDATGAVIGATARSSAADSLSARLAESVNQLCAAIADANRSAPADGRPLWSLRSAAAARYFQPTEPVVLLAGDAVAATVRMAEEGSLTCPLLPDVPVVPLPGALEAIEGAIDALAGTGGPGFNRWRVEPWSPFLLDWSVEVFPNSEGGNLTTPDRQYQPDFITRTYTLANDGVDLERFPERGAIVRGACVYTGSSLLSAHANPQLTESVTDYLMEQTAVLSAFAASGAITAECSTDPACVVANIAALQAWYVAQYLAGASPAEQAADPVYTAIRALTILPGLPALSQSLSGFNAALLMQKQTLELAVADPLAFSTAPPGTPGKPAFIDAVRAAVGDANGATPRPNTDFNPIRSGALRLAALRLVDAFGRIKGVSPKGVITSAAFSLGGSERLFRLLPRLTQPARLDFHFRATAPWADETSGHPACSPVCGWLLLNRLDRTIAVYSSTGVPLGTVQCGGGRPWERVPGGDGVEPEAIADPTLRRVVLSLLGGEPGYRPAFYLALESALQEIVPNGLARAQGIATLSSRPLAVARAQIRLEVQGLPAVHQGWNALRDDLRSDSRRTDGFTEVRFPVRIGDARQLDDGLVGYWVEGPDGALIAPFHAPKSEAEPIPAAGIRTAAGGPDNIELAVDGGPVALTLLLDPTGLVHAASGITPVKGIGIPGDRYHDALASLELSLLTAPLLTLAAQTELPLREEPGVAWSWLELRRDGWHEAASTGVVRLLSFMNVFGEAHGAAIWEQLLAKGWIAHLDPLQHSSTVTPKDQRSEALDPPFETDRIEIEALLLRAVVAPAETGATFTGPTAIREGWLKLRPMPQ